MGLWGSQSPLGSHTAGAVHSPRMPNQPAWGLKTQRSLKLIIWHANEVKSIHCFPSMTEIKSSCISAQEMVASFVINFHHSTRRGRDTESRTNKAGHWGGVSRWAFLVLQRPLQAQVLGLPTGSVVLPPPSIGCMLMALRYPLVPPQRKAASS